MIDLGKVKMIVWDLDDTFWCGTLSEGQIRWSERNIQFIKNLTDAGIINSICSKNDHDQVMTVLSEAGLWEYFVFPRISWNPKGEIVRDTVAEMNLRAENVLFIDDNPSNRSEVQYYSPKISVCGPEEIDKLCEACEKLRKKRIRNEKMLPAMKNSYTTAASRFLSEMTAATMLSVFMN